MHNYLRFEILKHFAYYEKLSKSMVEKAFSKHKHTTKTNRCVKHHRPEISEAFEFLKNEGLIIELNTDPGQGKVHGRGRPQRYYKITEYGLKKLIEDHRVSPTEFWEALHGYCIYNDAAPTPDELDDLLLIFVDHYIKYRNHGFTLYSDDFLNAHNNWFKEKIQTSSKTSTFQKVLEVLAVNPKITFNDLVEKVAESESNVKKVLSLYSYSTGSVQDSDIIIKDHSKENTDFITKNIITVNQENDNNLTYELSLLGVMWVLLIILYNNKKRLKCGLYIKKYSFKKYCDKIAYNYNHKLPLVFGKWDRLRQILQESAIYNLDVILSDNDLVDNKSRSSYRSVIVRGNEEIFEGIRKIVRYNNSLMQDLVSTGLEVLKDYFLVRFDLSALERLKDDATFKKTNPICAMLEEIIILLNPLWYRYPHLSLITLTTLDPNRILSQMEESLADEISALYYMNLLRPNVEVSMDHDSMLAEGSTRCNLNIDVSLLIKEIRGDPSLRDWIKKWREDISSVYQQLFETIKIWSLSTII